MHGPQADRLVTLTRTMVDQEAGAAEALSLAIGQIGTDSRATVGVYGTLINRVATAEMQARALASGGKDVHERLLEPIGDTTADYFVALVMQAAMATAKDGLHSPQAAEARNTLLGSYSNLETSPEFARDGLMQLALRLVMHERLRGLDVSTVVS
jgi:hypothetical protein